MGSGFVYKSWRKVGKAGREASGTRLVEPVKLTQNNHNEVAWENPESGKESGLSVGGASHDRSSPDLSVGGARHG